MKHHPITKRSLLPVLTILACSFLAASGEAQPPETSGPGPQVTAPTPVPAPQPQGQADDIEKSDPFTKASPAAEAKAAKGQSAESLDAQARILFARGETEKAIAMQRDAVEKARELEARLTETLARFSGEPVNKEIDAKLKNIILPVVNFEDTQVDQAVDFLRLRSVELDAAQPDPEKKGLNIVLLIPPDTDCPSIKQLRLRNVPIGVALKYVADAAKMRVSVESGVVVLKPAPEEQEGDYPGRPRR
jgi:hypothetical protein